jgi:hypothetical protein
MDDGVQGFLDNVTRVVGSRKDPTVICVVHSEAGLELLFNTNDLAMKLGMLDVAKMTIVEQQARYGGVRRRLWRFWGIKGSR